MIKPTRNNINYFLENFSDDIINSLIKLLQNNTLKLSSNDFELKLPGSLGCMLSHITLWETIENM